MAGRTRPIEKFAAAVGKCSTQVSLFSLHGIIDHNTNMSIQSAEYGKCIVADYNNVKKDKCAKEFMKLQECYMVCMPYCSLHLLLMP